MPLLTWGSSARFLLVVAAGFLSASSLATDPTREQMVYIDATRQSTEFVLSPEHATGNEYFVFRIIQRPEVRLVSASLQVNAVFCSQCGEWQLLYAAGTALPTHDSHTFSCFSKLGGNGTGTIIDQARCQFSPVQWTADSTHWLVLYVKELTCDVMITATTMNSSRPLPPVVGTIAAERSYEDSTIIVDITPATDRLTSGDQLQYKLFWTNIYARGDFESGWCHLNEAGDWQKNVTRFILNGTNALDEYVLTVKVRNNAGVFAEYPRVLLEESPQENIVRIASNVVIPLMIVIPLVAIFGGYHKAFGARFLVFQYVHAFDSDVAPIDIMMKKATTHSIVLLSIQAVCQLALIITALVVGDYISLHMPAALLAIPLLVIGVMSVVRKMPIYLLAFIIMVMWFAALQITIVQIMANLGSDSIYSDNRQKFLEAPMIISQVIIAINVIAIMLSLNPLYFLYMKLGGSAAGPSLTTERTSKATVAMSCVFLVSTLLWVEVSLYFMPQVTITPSTELHFWIEAHIFTAIAMFSLLSAFGTVYDSPSASFLSLLIQYGTLAFNFVAVIVDIAENNRYHDHPSQSLVKAIVYILRFVACIAQVFLVVLATSHYKQLTGETTMQLLRQLNPKNFTPRIGGIANAITLFLSTVMTLLAVVVIVFRVDGADTATLELYVLLYLLLLGQPATLLGAGLNSVVFLVLGWTLEIMPTYVWLSFAFRNGPLYVGILILQLILMLSAVVTGIITLCSRPPENSQTHAEDVVTEPLEDGGEELQLAVQHASFEEPPPPLELEEELQSHDDVTSE